MTQVEQIRAKCKEVCEKALAKYGVDLTGVRVSFNLKGSCAGKASGTRWRGVASDYTVKFNFDMLTREAFDHVLNSTVAHEYAHVLCFMKPDLGKNHNSGWERVCLALGGTGNRNHSEEVVYGKGITYEYTTDRGHKVRLSQRKHNQIQAGGTITYRGNMGVVRKGCAHQVVGYQGRTLAEPVRKVEATIPTVAPKLVITPLPVHVVTRNALPSVDVGRVIGGFTLRTVAAAPVQQGGESKAAVSRRIMLSGYRGGKTYEEIINAMISANGYDRQLARATFKANAPKVGIPSNWGG